MGAVVLALAGVWCTVRLVRSLPEKQDLSDIKIVQIEEDAPPVASDAAPTELGPVIAKKRCTVPAGERKLSFQVKLKRGSTPAWVHLRFENGSGAPAGDGLWYQNVKQSKKSPKAGLVAPEGATAAFIEVVKAHEKDVCDVTELTLEAFKEKTK